MSTGAILAHQGGWDEILFVLAPLLIFAVLLRAARRRVDLLEADDADNESTEPEQPQVSDTP